MFKKIYKSILNFAKRNNFTTSTEILQNDVRQDAKQHQQSIDAIKQKSQLFSKIVIDEKEKVDRAFEIEMKKMDEEKEKINQMIESLKD